ncbi:hypothetical protein ACLOJK_034032 [Asimina triloba]
MRIVAAHKRLDLVKATDGRDDVIEDTMVECVGISRGDADSCWFRHEDEVTSQASNSIIPNSIFHFSKEFFRFLLPPTAHLLQPSSQPSSSRRSLSHSADDLSSISLSPVQRPHLYLARLRLADLLPRQFPSRPSNDVTSIATYCEPLLLCAYLPPRLFPSYCRPTIKSAFARSRKLPVLNSNSHLPLPVFPCYSSSQ